MTANVPPPIAHPDTQLSREQMLLIREQVKDRLIHEFHSHRLTGRLYRNAGNTAMAGVEEAHMRELETMIKALEEEPEPVRGLSNIRLTEDEDSS